MGPGLGIGDALVIAAYLGAVLGMSWVLARRQTTGEDYFLAGRRMGGAVLSLSILANQASAVSLVGAPAFVALRPGGGLRWLQYELALPLAMLALIGVLLVPLRSVPGSSIYELLERRFGRPTRRALAAVFLLSRGLSLGVILYASALVVSTGLGWPVDRAILLVGLFSVAYTSMGGIAADIWSDVLQLAVLWVGVVASAAVVLLRHGGAVLAAVPPDRMQALVAGNPGVGEGGSFALWPMLLGGFFLYLSYYGCDQSQAQRLLTASTAGQARRALVLTGLLRFPLVLTYCGFGLVLAGLLALDPALARAMIGKPADALVPVFMMVYLPEGLRGLLIAAILAAAMSSIDSAMNALAAVTLEDVVGLPPSEQRVWLSRSVSLAWGLFAVGSGMAFARVGGGVLELVNQIGSLFYGPVLAVFVVGALAPGAAGRHALAGLAAGLAANVALALLAPQVSWLWWNAAGFAAATAATLGWARTGVSLRPAAWRGREAAILGAAFAAMLAVLVGLSAL